MIEYITMSFHFKTWYIWPRRLRLMDEWEPDNVKYWGALDILFFQLEWRIRNG